MKKTLRPISACVCAAITLSLLTPLSSAQAASKSLLAEENESFSEIYWCSDEEAFLNLFPPSNFTAAETVEPSGNYRYTITEGPDSSVLIDLTIKINGLEISASGDGTITSLIDSSELVDGKLRGQLETSDGTYSILVAFQKILGQKEEYIGVTFASSNSEIFFVDFGVPVLSQDLLENSNLPVTGSPTNSPRLGETTDFWEKYAFTNDADYQKVAVSQDANSKTRVMVNVVSDMNEIEDIGFEDFFKACVDSIEIRLTAIDEYAEVAGFKYLPTNLEFKLGESNTASQSFDNYASIMITALSAVFPIAGTIADISYTAAQELLSYSSGKHTVGISATKLYAYYSATFGIDLRQPKTFTSFDEMPCTVVFDLSTDYNAKPTITCEYNLQTNMTYRVVSFDSWNGRYSHHYVDAEPLDEDIILTLPTT